MIFPLLQGDRKRHRRYADTAARHIINTGTHRREAYGGYLLHHFEVTDNLNISCGVVHLNSFHRTGEAVAKLSGSK